MSSLTTKDVFKKMENQLILNDFLDNLGYNSLDDFINDIDLYKNEQYEYKEYRNALGNLLESLANFILVMQKENENCYKFSLDEYENLDKDAYNDCLADNNNELNILLKGIVKGFMSLGLEPDNELLNILKELSKKSENK